MQRINSAADDAAGLAISNALESQVRGLDMGTHNTLNMQSLVTTAEGGLSTISDSLQRMRELSIQASNGIMTDDQRAMIQTEVAQLRDHINMTTRNTQWNGMNILDGSFNGHTASDAMGRGASVNIPDMSTIALGLDNFDVTRMPLGGDGRVDRHASAARTSALGNQLTNAQNTLATRNAEMNVARDTFATASGNFAQAEVNFQLAESNYNSSRNRLNDAMIDAGVTSIDQLMNTNPSNLSDAAATEIRNALQQYNDSAIAFGSDSLGLAAVTDATALENWGIDSADQIQANQVNYGRGVAGATLTANDDMVGQIGAFDTAQSTFAGAQIAFDSAVFARDQAQATVGRLQSMVSQSSADTRAAFSSSSLNVLDNAISQVNSARASLGAISNRFDHTVASNNVSMLNQAAARSRIVDLDVARETSNLRRLQILQQYQIANQRNAQQTAATMMLSLLG